LQPNSHPPEMRTVRMSPTGPITSLELRRPLRMLFGAPGLRVPVVVVIHLDPEAKVLTLDSHQVRFLAIFGEKSHSERVVPSVMFATPPAPSTTIEKKGSIFDLSIIALVACTFTKLDAQSEVVHNTGTAEGSIRHHSKYEQHRQIHQCHP